MPEMKIFLKIKVPLFFWENKLLNYSIAHTSAGQELNDGGDFILLERLTQAFFQFGKKKFQIIANVGCVLRTSLSV